VHESQRSRGLGRRLLQAVEAEARKRSCLQIVLNTHSFQAPEFYRKHGYSSIGVFEDYPRGHAQIFLQKRLT
jgi:ribosomal protein S18 acetylase RimI-like enzyme